MGRRWIVMMTRNRDSGVSIKKGDGIMTAIHRTVFRVCFFIEGVVTIIDTQGISAFINKARLE